MSREYREASWNLGKRFNFPSLEGPRLTKIGFVLFLREGLSQLGVFEKTKIDNILMRF